MKMWVACRLSVLLSVVVACTSADTGSPYAQCTSTAQCGPGNCCVVVRGRFDTTACSPLLRAGEQCRPPSDTPYDTTLYFPGGSSVAVTGVHQSLCPCEPSAACVRGTCVAK